MIYLDHNATAPLHRQVARAMTEAMALPRGNPSSLHAIGRHARELVEAARADVAALLGCAPETVHFTGGGTEGNVQALRGAFELGAGRQGLAVSAVEHPSVLHTARWLQARGARLTELGVDRQGRLQPFELAADTRLVAVMAANNETGNLHDVPAVARQAHAAGALCHCDAVQALGKVPVDVAAWQVDTCAVSAHKLGGPQGVGALYVRPGLPLPALLTGGGQEHGRRSGTENVVGIVGFGAAAFLARERLAESAGQVARLRDRLEERLLAALPDVAVQGDRARRLPNTSSLAFRGLKGEALLVALDAAGICVSTGSACSSGSGRPSHVLVAMGVPQAEIDGALRLSLGADTTAAEVDSAAAALIEAVQRLRELAGDA